MKIEERNQHVEGLHKEFNTIVEEFRTRLKEFQKRSDSILRTDIWVEFKNPRSCPIYDVDNKVSKNRVFIFDADFTLITE